MDGSLDGVTVEYWVGGVLQTVAFPNTEITISETHQIWYADRSDSTIKTLDMPDFANYTPSAEHFPLLYTGKYQETMLAKSDFAEWIAIKREPFVEWLKNDLLKNGDTNNQGAYLYKSISGVTKWELGTFNNGIWYNIVPLSDLEDGTYIVNFNGTYPRYDFRAIGVLFYCTSGTSDRVYYGINSGYVSLQVTSTHIQALNSVSNSSGMEISLTMLKRAISL